MKKADIKREIATLKKEMKENNVRVTSCFNGGLSREEMRCNQELFRLKTQLERCTE